MSTGFLKFIATFYSHYIPATNISRLKMRRGRDTICRQDMEDMYMKKDIKYTLNLAEMDGAQARAEQKAAVLEADNQLAENAKIRLGDVKLEKWWSVAAGMALILAFILYTFYLTIPAVILFVLLGAFIIYVFVKQHRQRRRIEEAEPEISPNRCVDNIGKLKLRKIFPKICNVNRHGFF